MKTYDQEAVPLRKNTLQSCYRELNLYRRPPRAKRSGTRWWLLLAILAAAAYVIWENREPLDTTPVTALHPTIALKQAELTAEAARIGIEILITDGLRTIEEQNALYRKGRTVEGQVVTNVQGGDSYHNYGLAIDFALRTKEGDVVWDMEYDGNRNGQSDWMEVVTIAKGLGFSWGGDWQSFPDYPHLQMDFGYSIRELKRGERPQIDNS